ncbi:zinc-binding alcohol dehydrogenase family protein [Corynebacterium gallinarum]|uniref:Zinc-type alcohol dehydrogenase-like protein n=1 Tax=Corynebacterium gallinarum TaxID=2762214 RepID=A0A8I0HIG3_9CORY|nr:zinc-binding alcohol dehydrogenase family protein [Corynebacterium gallinarum]MBD8029665.1 zinc-binding alcohol dehydrogenase family protein [Corynebacterium gallinarum]
MTELPHTMPAVGLVDSLPADHPDFLIDVEVPRPDPGPRDLLVEITAVSINPVDTKVRMRVGKQDTPKILGYDAAGTVVAVGSEVSLFRPGDTVFYAGSNQRQGTNARFHLVDERLVGHAPGSVDATHAAALPLVCLTAWEALFDRLPVTQSTTGTLLVLGGAGGVPSALIQLARALTNLRVVATASRPESTRWVREMGAHDVINHHHDLREQISGVDFVFSSWTTGREEELAAVMSPQSHLVLIDDPLNPNLGTFKQKSIAVHWEFMFTRAMFETPDMEMQGQILTKIADMVDRGQLRSVTDRVLTGLTAESLMEGHRLIEEGHTTGKIVVKV